MADISHHVISALVDDTDTIIDTSYSVLQASALTRDESVQKATCALLYQFSLALRFWDRRVARGQVFSRTARRSPIHEPLTMSFC